MPAPDIQQLPSGPAMMRMPDGTYQPTLKPARPINTQRKKLLIVIQYYEQDREQAEELGTLIADLERVRNTVADILVFRRADATNYSLGVLEKLRDKFDRVFFETCRRRDAKGYPFGPNQMWGDLVTLMSQSNQWRDNYYAFLPLESDCTPVHPGWINELIEEFRVAQARGYAAIGHIHENPVQHLNGVAVYDTNLWKIVGGNRLNGSDPQVAYDIQHRESILPIAFDTPLVMMQYQRPTITSEDLFKPWKNGFEPALFHGVKDGSARAAVRAKHVTFSAIRDISDITVFTYEHQRPNNPAAAEKYVLWYDAWKSRGWNPIKLSLRDAVRGIHCSEIQKNLAKMLTIMPHNEAVGRLLRWVALETVGGGFMVDPEVLPNQFLPEKLDRKPKVFVAPGCIQNVQAAVLNKDTLTALLDRMRKHQFDSENRLLDPELFFLSQVAPELEQSAKMSVCGQENWRSAPLVTFSQPEMQRIGHRGTSVLLMEKFLRES
jgi:hypothetical protein